MDDNTPVLEAPASSRIDISAASRPPLPEPRPLAPDPRATLVERCRAWRTRMARLRVSIALSAAQFVACQGPSWMCCSSRADYAREHLGMRAATFTSFVAAGRLLQRLPAAVDALLDGRLAWSALLELTALPTVEQAALLLELACGQSAREVRALVRRALASQQEGPDAPDARPDTAKIRDCTQPSATDSERRAGKSAPLDGSAPADGSANRPAPAPTRTLVPDPLDTSPYQSLTLRLPPEVALYADHTLELARAVCGLDGPDDLALDAIVAEAAERIPVTVAAPDACRRLGVGKAPLATDAVPPTTTMPMHDAPRLQGLAQTRAGAHPAVSRLDLGHRTRRDAHRLDRWLRRQTARLQLAQAHQQDQLLQLWLDDVPRRLGYPSLAAMAAALLDLPEATTWDYMRRARRRLRDHPIAIARAAGQLTDVQADVLETLQAQAHVPNSALPAWVDRAQRVTVRKLRDMLTWARRQTYTDARAWANAGYTPPDDQQLRTSSRLIEDIAKDPTPPDPVPLLIQADAVHLVKVRWVLRTETLVTLAQLMASIQDDVQRRHERATGELCQRPTTWWALLGVMVLARREWATLARQTDYDSHPILKRDNFRCAAAGCTQRRDLQAHHLHYRGRGGGNQRGNRVPLCAFHHQLGEHGGILRVRGTAIPDATALRWQLALDMNGRPTRVTRGDDILYDGRRWRSREGPVSQA